MPALTLQEYVSQVGLNDQGAAFMRESFGTHERPVEEWQSLLAGALATPDTAWLSGCFTGSNAAPGGAGLPEGEGFFERNSGVVQATPLLHGAVTTTELSLVTTFIGAGAPT